MGPDGNKRSFLDPAVVARLAGVPFLARRPMQGQLSGRHASAHRGASVEFAEYRKYVPGDDLRRLDWRAYGRSDRHYVKEFEADTNLRCSLVVDTSGSMGFGSTGATKLDYARKIVASLAYLAIQQGDAAGLACVAEGIVRSLPARRNPAHLATLFDMLEQIRPSGPTRLVETLHEIAETTPQRALVVVVSDFFVDPIALRDCFEHFRFRKHDLAAFHLLDPQELGFAFQRPTRFLDMEGGAALFADPSEIAERYHRALNRYLEAIKRASLETRLDYHRLSTAEHYEQAVTRFLIGRTRSGGVR